MHGRLDGQFPSWIKEGLFRYTDDTRKGASLNVRLQLPSVVNTPSIKRILNKSSLVKKSPLFQSFPSFARWFHDSKIIDNLESRV